MGKGAKGEGEPSDNLYISGLPAEFDTDAVKQFFSAIGNVMQCKSFGNGFALVRFASLEEALTVRLSLNGQKPIGCEKPMEISFAASQGAGDWNCPRCGDLQFSKNTHCRLCQCPRGDAPSVPSVPGTGAGRVPCKFFAQGICAKGDQCPFTHDGIGGTVPGYGKACGKGGAMSPYGDKGDGKHKGGPMCTIQDLLSELVAGGLPGGDQDPSQNCIYVGGLPEDTTNQNLYEIFATFGALAPRGAKVEATPEGLCVGWGLVNFVEATCADMAVMALNGIGLATGGKLEVRRK